jgi:hypothetical protein
MGRVANQGRLRLARSLASCSARALSPRYRGRMAIRQVVADPLEASGRLLAEVADKEIAALAARRQELTAAAERLVAAELDRRAAPAALPLARDVTTVVLALFDGLMRQRRTDPATVPDDLFPQALRWLLTGLAADEPRGTQGHPSCK